MFILEINEELIEACKDPGLVSILKIIQNGLSIVRIIVPIILIISMIWIITKMLVNPEEKKYVKLLRNSVLAAVIVFFIPTLLNLAMSWLDDSFSVTACWNVAKSQENLVNWNDPGEVKEDPNKKKLPTSSDVGYADEQKKDSTTTSSSTQKKKGSEAIITCGDYYNKKLIEAVKKGEKWVYSNSNKYVKQSGTFEQMLKGKIRGGNCASIANWAFRDMGIISNGEKFYGDSNGKIRHYNSGDKKIKSKLDKACKIIKTSGKSFSSLVKEGKVKAGDVIIGKGHTYVYRGGSQVFASGHDSKWHTDSSVKTEDSRKAVFEKWIINYKGTYDAKFKPTYIIRIKDDFVPKYYRDSKGNLIKN